jgi:hypothetical protein
MAKWALDRSDSIGKEARSKMPTEDFLIEKNMLELRKDFGKEYNSAKVSSIRLKFVCRSFGLSYLNNWRDIYR